LFEDNLFRAEKKDGEKPAKRVTVYSTPTCSWCNTLKTYLKLHNVLFNDIDLSRDQKAAEALVKRSGQTGVPQTDINGEIVVGFNKARINQLLGING
jgi:glutaredoxin-like YruB-family protein